MLLTVVLEKTLKSPLDCKEIQSVHPKGNQSWIFIGRTDVETEAPIIWPPEVKNWLIGKDPGAGKDWRQEKGMTEDEMVGWHHQLNGHEFSKFQEMVMGREAWYAAVHGATKIRMQLRNCDESTKKRKRAKHLNPVISLRLRLSCWICVVGELIRLMKKKASVGYFLLWKWSHYHWQLCQWSNRA